MLIDRAPSESPRCRSASRRILAPEIHEMIREATVKGKPGEPDRNKPFSLTVALKGILKRQKIV